MNQSVSNILGGLGIVLYLLSGWLYLAAGLIVPQPWHLLFLGAWLAGWLLVYQFWRDRRAWIPLLGIGAALLWPILIELGSWLFGWTA